MSTECDHKGIGAYVRCVLLGLLVTAAPACRKFLNKVPDTSLQMPATVADYQSLLDENTITTLSTPGLGPLYVDDYTEIASSLWALDTPSAGLYTWEPLEFENAIDASWNNPYAAIYTCNTVLAGIPELTGLTSTDQAAASFVMGQAYFVRAFMYYHLEETFGRPYRSASAGVDLGVPLRISENVDAQVPRASVSAVYQQIVGDLQQAVRLLPVALQTNNRDRACRSAAYGLLARAWLTQQDYIRAQAYADSSLMLYDSLVDFNTIDSNSLHPFVVTGNSEVLFQCSANSYELQWMPTTCVDSVLYSSYAPDDLRRVIFFAPAAFGITGYTFKGQYTGLVYLFSGVAVDEVLLIRAESKAWNGDAAGAMADVNTLLAKRWRTGRFQPLGGTTAASALQIVMTEKRKETLFREGRFYDMRRWNQYPFLVDTMRRVYNGITYTLLPGSVRYAFPIPLAEISLDGIKQNPE